MLILHFAPRRATIGSVALVPTLLGLLLAYLGCRTASHIGLSSELLTHARPGQALHTECCRHRGLAPTPASLSHGVAGDALMAGRLNGVDG